MIYSKRKYNVNNKHTWKKIDTEKNTITNEPSVQ